MPIQGVAFRAPDPYPLPADFAAHLRAQPEAEALRMISQLLIDNHCADLVVVERLERDGKLRVASAAGALPPAQAAAKALLDGSAASAYTTASDIGQASPSAQAIAAGTGMLFMGEVTLDETAIPLPDLHQYLLAGADKANLGFYYANPIVDGAGKIHGVLTISRSLASGALNHDQPALVRALVLVLAENLASAPVI